MLQDNELSKKKSIQLSEMIMIQKTKFSYNWIYGLINLKAQSKQKIPQYSEKFLRRI